MTQALGRLRLELIDEFCGVHVPLFDKVGTSVLIVTSLFIRCVLARELSGYASHGSLHSGQTPDRRMAEASSEKRIVTSLAREILANAQECTSDCARMHRLELDEPNVRPWLKLCSVTWLALPCQCAGARN